MDSPRRRGQTSFPRAGCCQRAVRYLAHVTSSESSGGLCGGAGCALWGLVPNRTDIDRLIGLRTGSVAARTRSGRVMREALWTHEAGPLGCRNQSFRVLDKHSAPPALSLSQCEGGTCCVLFLGLCKALAGWRRMTEERARIKVHCPRLLCSESCLHLGISPPRSQPGSSSGCLVIDPRNVFSPERDQVRLSGCAVPSSTVFLQMLV